MIRTLGRCGLVGERIAGRRGVWVPGPRKIASIGVAVEGWVTLHGFALNVSTDLDAFASFHPCGFDPSIMTSMEQELGRKVPLDEAAQATGAAWVEIFGPGALPRPAGPPADRVRSSRPPDERGPSPASPARGRERRPAWPRGPSGVPSDPPDPFSPSASQPARGGGAGRVATRRCERLRWLGCGPEGGGCGRQRRMVPLGEPARVPASVGRPAPDAGGCQEEWRGSPPSSERAGRAGAARIRSPLPPVQEAVRSSGRRGRALPPGHPLVDALRTARRPLVRHASVDGPLSGVPDVRRRPVPCEPAGGGRPGPGPPSRGGQLGGGDHRCRRPRGLPVPGPDRSHVQCPREARPGTGGSRPVGRSHWPGGSSTWDRASCTRTRSNGS